MEKNLVDRLSQMPLSTDDTFATWIPPDWEEVVKWWDQFVEEARTITGKSYRGKFK
jgi:hypothetical protein